MSKIASRVCIGIAVLSGLALARPAAAQGPYSFYPINPCRVYDSRPNNYWAANVSEGGAASSVTRKLAVRATACAEVPTSAQAISYNATVVNPTYQGHLTLYPSHLAAPPLISNLNFQAAVSATANGGIVKLNPSPDATNLDLGGQLFFGAPLGAIPPPGAHLVLDLTGYFQ